MTGRRSMLPGAILGAALLAVSVIGLRAYGMQQTVPAGLSVGGLPLEGLPLREAAERLQDRTGRLNGQPIRFETDYEPAAGGTGTFRELGLRWDLSAVESDLQKLGRGNPYNRAILRWKLRGKAYAPDLHADERVYRAFVEKTWAGLHAAKPTPARRIITDKDRVEIIPDVAAYRVDGEELLLRLRHADWQQVWRDVADGTAEGAEPLTVRLPLNELRAEATLESLTNQGVDRKIAEFSTAIAPGDPGRLHNISAAAKTVHDTLLPPDAVFDYAPVVKNTEARYGFREAPVIYNGKLVSGVGGGICQVSSTLYNAVLRAGLEIVERRNHSLPVSYVPMGQDATFSEGYINFRFRNNTGAHLLIRTETDKERLTVKLFGRMPESVVYTIESVTVEELEAPVKTVVNPSLKPGQRETLQKGKPGYVVETYRTKTDNGTILSKERISKDRYLPQPTLVAVGGQADSGPRPAPGGQGGVLEDGVRGPRFR